MVHKSTAVYIESRPLKAIRTVIDENTLFFFKMFKYYFLDSLSLKTEILPILAILSWKYLIFSLFQSFAFEWDKKGLKSYIYVFHGSMHHKNSTLVSKRTPAAIVK